MVVTRAATLAPVIVPVPAAVGTTVGDGAQVLEAVGVMVRAPARLRVVMGRASDTASGTGLDRDHHLVMGLASVEAVIREAVEELTGLVVDMAAQVAAVATVVVEPPEDMGLEM